MDLEGKIKISELKPHPRNNYYFDDMEGDAWDSLLQSIGTSGVTNAITINSNKIIISGHQRIRACNVLGIEEVSYKLINYDDEEKEIKDLIESNLRQRVLGNTNPVKLGRCFEFLNKWYGFERGGNHGNQYTVANEKVFNLPNDEPSTQKELAQSYGITQQTMNNYMRMASMIPELEDLVDTGIVTKDTALAIIKNLSIDEQRELISSMDITKKITKRDVKKYINEIKNLKKENEELKKKESSIDELELKAENERLKTANENLEILNKTLEDAKNLSDEIANKYKSNSDEYDAFKNQIVDMGLNPNGEFNTYLAISEISNLYKKLQNLLLDELAPIKYKDYIFVVKENKTIRENFINILELLKEWYSSMYLYLGEELKEEIINNNIIDMEEN